MSAEQVSKTFIPLNRNLKCLRIIKTLVVVIQLLFLEVRLEGQNNNCTYLQSMTLAILIANLLVYLPTKSVKLFIKSFLTMVKSWLRPRCLVSDHWATKAKLH